MHYEGIIGKIGTVRLIIILFIIAFGVRLGFTILTPQYDNWTDLCIYMNGGRLLSNAVNPYDYSDGIETRVALRMADIKENPEHHHAENQELWDSYSGSNLPLSLLLYGVIDSFSSTPFAYRMAFAFLDSLLSIFIGLFILRFWKGDMYLTKIITILGLGALSPVLLKWGTILPEDKGAQILLMISALYFSRSESKPIRFYLSSIVLGASIAFKLFGVFIIPICLYYALSQPRRILDSKTLINGSLYLLLTGVFTFVWFLPFAPEVFITMFNRFVLNVAGEITPIHASIWRTLYLIFPDYWYILKNVFIFSFLLITIVGFINKRINLEVACANILISFVVLFLTTGAFNRMNIGILLSILLFGVVSYKGSILLTFCYIVGGLVSLSHSIFLKLIVDRVEVHKFIASNEVFFTLITDYEFIDSVFALVFILIYTVIIANLLKTKKNAQIAYLLSN